MGVGRNIDSSLSRVIPGGGTNPDGEADDADMAPCGRCWMANRAAYCGSRRGLEGDGSDNLILLRVPVRLLLEPEDEQELFLGVALMCWGKEVVR